MIGLAAIHLAFNTVKLPAEEPKITDVINQLLGLQEPELQKLQHALTLFEEAQKKQADQEKVD